MKKIILCCLLLSTILAANAGKSYFSKFSGPYLGQKPTGTDSLSGQSTTGVPLMLTYVANMGVMVSSGDFKVLIDGLFDKPSQYYRVPSPDTLKAVMKGEAPFDGIDLVLFTHKHSDHFDAALAVRYMEARPEPILVAPSDAVEAMRKAAYDWSRIEPRLVPIDLKVGKNVKREVACIPLTVVRT
ncbi:MAG: MBL fold metallo-hydrolase, partial [Chrysiogenales bacterium]